MIQLLVALLFLALPMCAFLAAAAGISREEALKAAYPGALHSRENLPDRRAAGAGPMAGATLSAAAANEAARRVLAIDQVLTSADSGEGAGSPKR